MRAAAKANRAKSNGTAASSRGRASAAVKERELEIPQPPVNSGEREALQRALRVRTEAASPDHDLDPESRLAQLAAIFGLSDFERDVVAALWTTAYAPEWRHELAARDVFPGHLTVLGLARCFGRSPRVRLSTGSPLRVWRIVAEHAFVEGTAALSLDPHVLAWLDGDHEIAAGLVARVRLLPPLFELPSWGLDACASRLRAGIDRGDRWRVRLSARDGFDPLTAEAMAYGLARRLGVLALAADLDGVTGEELHDCAVRVQRQAFLDRCAPCWTSTADIQWPREIVPFPVQFVLGGEPLKRDDRFRDVDLTVPAPSVEERRTLWLEALPPAAGWPEDRLDDLARGCEASAGEILRAASTGPRDAREAAQRIREGSADDLGGLAERMPCGFAWDDLIVPAPVRDRLEDVAFEARERARLWAEPEASRLYPQGRGLVALLAGPPGTGKTMAAQVIAADLGLELMRVDVSRVLSKWVGETAQHLQKILSSVSSRRAVLLFDEADALFGRRIEEAKQAQDHFVNMDISHLMVALEAYTGVVLLATNLKANIDAAFVRRIRHAIDFPMPDFRAREAIWAQAVGALFGQPLANATRDAVGRVARVDASGAQIKNAALSAVFAARRARRSPDAQLLGSMLARELAKDGVGLSARELETTLGSSLEVETGRAPALRGAR